MTTNPPHATLFIQCLVDGFYPEVAEAMVKVLRRLGVRLDCPTDQTCCGQPAFNSGYRDEARKAARRFIALFENSEAIVCPSGSCVAMVRRHYPELFGSDGPWLDRARRVADKTYELSQYLVDVLGVADVGARFSGRATFHDSCHPLRYLGVREQPRKLIRAAAGAELVEMTDSDRCCGFGGAFSVKYPEISTAMVDYKVQRIIEAGVDAVVGCDMGCLMNIGGYLGRMGADVKILHLAQLLAKTGEG